MFWGLKPMCISAKGDLKVSAMVLAHFIDSSKGFIISEGFGIDFSIDLMKEIAAGSTKYV
jgi:hypothetical protein